MRDLNFRHLYYFWTVAKEGNLTRSAQQMHISQSALSSQIKQLEEQLNQRLFNRQGRTLQLTESGYLVLEYAESIFSLGSEMLSMMESGGLKRVQRLRVGAVATLSRNFQENFLKPVLAQEDVQLVLHSSALDDLLEQLEVHKLDLILSNRPVASDSSLPWRCQLLARQSVCLVGPDTDAFNQLNFPQDLANVRVLVPGPSSDIRVQFDMFCQQHGLDLTPYAEVDDMAMLRLMTRDSGGVSVVPEVVVQDEIESGLLKKYCTLEGVIENFYAITAKRHFELPILKTLLAENS